MYIFYLFISATNRHLTLTGCSTTIYKLTTLIGNGRDEVGMFLAFQHGFQELDNCKQRGEKKQASLIL
jgi:hypothetical protein